MATDDDDPKVKDVLGQTSEEDLARWFSLPSFQQVAEEKPEPAEPAMDPEMAAKIERRDKAIANVDRELLEAIHQRTDENPRDLLNFKPNLEVHIDRDFGLLDEAFVGKRLLIAEPREYGLPPEIEEELKECAPQALLRDLHRPETQFDKQFEIVDMAADQKLDIVAEVATAMRTSWKLPTLEDPLAENKRELADLAAAKRRPWTEYLPSLRNRRVRE